MIANGVRASVARHGSCMAGIAVLMLMRRRIISHCEWRRMLADDGQKKNEHQTHERKDIKMKRVKLIKMINDDDMMQVREIRLCASDIALLAFALANEKRLANQETNNSQFSPL